MSLLLYSNSIWLNINDSVMIEVDEKWKMIQMTFKNVVLLYRDDFSRCEADVI